MKIANTEITQRRYCGGKDLRYGYQDGECKNYGAKGVLENQEPIHHGLVIIS